MITIQGQIANLGEGILSGPAEGLLTVRPGASVWVQNITLVNTDTQNRTCNVYINRGGTRRRISPKDITLRPSYAVELNSGYSLQAGQSIDADASVAGAIEWTISGLEVAQ
jgi:hypothetical protein